MNMDVNDNHIDWDRLLDIIERSEANPDSLNDEELAMLAAAREMRVRLNMDKFSAEDGWLRFTEKRDRQKHTYNINISRWLVAASTLLIIGLGIWRLSSKKTPLQNMAVAPVEKIKLKRSNGAVLVLGDSSKTVQDKAVHIQSDSSSITYTATANRQAAVIFDTLEVPRGRTYALELPDGTRVSLNASSRLVFPEVFNGDKREVYVEGETFFDVKHDALHPFIVHAGNVSMTVLGTAFNVNTLNKDLTTTLIRGKVLVTAQNNSVVLLPGEQSVYNNGSLRKQQVDTRIYTAWYYGDLFFDDATLADITGTLARVYDYSFVFDDPSMEAMRFTLDMKKPADIEDVLEQIRKTGSGIVFNVDGRNVSVKKKK